MRKIVSVILMLCLLCGSSALAGSSSFDSYAERHNPVTIQNPVFPQVKTAAEMAGDDSQLTQFIARAWYNMLAYETEVLGTNIQKTKAADIYRGIKKGPGISVFASPGGSSEYMSAIFAFKDRLIWIECNTNTQVECYFEWKYPIDKQKKDEGYLTEYTASSLIGAAAGGNVITGGYAGSVTAAYGTKTKIWKVFDAAYKAVTDKKNPIK